ncbi:hypothetical protein J008_03696 [Cryptococcus neoformans]|nr:hypothetical protein C367_03603 [Cryptococcus neoformans var. grubii Ze90-1]OXH31115.1 hypothetical protein J008_03696 [Cryptococcus neoformans var. grubii]
MPRGPSIPPYLTAGASSRTHHALLAQLSQADSAQEEDQIIAHHLTQAKAILQSNDVNTTRIAENLIVILHCTMLRHNAEDDLDFALMPALKLAEAGKTIQERRIGYLFLVERLSPDHELHLLLINTIRKDLSSNQPASILLALHTIVKLPSRDLGPAVTPLLISKPLLRHTSAAIRQRTYQALVALHLSSTFPRTPQPHSQAESVPFSFPLSMSKVVKAVCRENDSSCLCVLFKLLGRLIHSGAHVIKNEEERGYLVQVVLDKAEEVGWLGHGQAEGGGEGGELILESVRLLGTLVSAGILEVDSAEAGEEVREQIEEWIRRKMEEMGMDGSRSRSRSQSRSQSQSPSQSQSRSGRGMELTRWKKAFLLQVCGVAPMVPAVIGHCLGVVSRLLIPSSFPSTSSSSSSSTSAHRPTRTHTFTNILPPPNEHILALRCLLLLPPQTWDRGGKMGEEEMGVVMEGVGSGDASVRRLTIELLYTLSPDLARMVFGNYLESIVTSTNLSLPLDTQTQTLGMEERTKVKMGRRETAGRALEVCEVVAHVQARVRPWPGGVGEKEGGSGNEEASVVNWGDVVSVLATLGEKEKEKDVEGDADGDGWEEGVKRVMDLVRLYDPSGELLVDAIHARYERPTTHEAERGRQGHAHEHEHETLWIQSPTVVMLLGSVACEFSASGLGNGMARQNKRASLRGLLSTAALGGSPAGWINSENSTIGVIPTTTTARTTSMLSPALQEIVLLAFVALLRDDGEGEGTERIRKDVESLAKGAKGYIKRRCDEVIYTIDNGLAREVGVGAKSSSLSDTRTSLVDTVAMHKKRAALKSESETTRSPLSWSTSTATKQLRYAAYGSK